MPLVSGVHIRPLRGVIAVRCADLVGDRDLGGAVGRFW